MKANAPKTNDGAAKKSTPASLAQEDREAGVPWKMSKGRIADID